MMNPRLFAGFMIPGEIKCTARVLSPPCCLIMELAPYIPALCPDSSSKPTNQLMLRAGAGVGPCRTSCSIGGACGRTIS
jgi:hypothetical protein